MQSTLPPAQSYGNEIDLTASPRKQVAMATEDDAIDVSSDDEEDVKQNIMVLPHKCLEASIWPHG